MRPKTFDHFFFFILLTAAFSFFYIYHIIYDVENINWQGRSIYQSWLGIIWYSVNIITALSWSFEGVFGLNLENRWFRTRYLIAMFLLYKASSCLSVAIIVSLYSSIETQKHFWASLILNILWILPITLHIVNYSFIHLTLIYHTIKETEYDCFKTFCIVKYSTCFTSVIVLVALIAFCFLIPDDYSHPFEMVLMTMTIAFSLFTQSIVYIDQSAAADLGWNYNLVDKINTFRPAVLMTLLICAILAPLITKTKMDPLVHQNVPSTAKVDEEFQIFGAVALLTYLLSQARDWILLSMIDDHNDYLESEYTSSDDGFETMATSSEDGSEILSSSSDEGFETMNTSSDDDVKNENIFKTFGNVTTFILKCISRRQNRQRNRLNCCCDWP